MEHKFQVFSHIVTYNSAKYIAPCIEALLSQEGFVLGDNLEVYVTDNASHDNTAEIINGFAAKNVNININPENLGFCAAHNQLLQSFLDGKKTFFLCLNPDLKLDAKALWNLCAKLDTFKKAGSACPKLLRADDNLNPLSTKEIDAAGMYITPSLRHFDRGSGESDKGQYDNECYVFGASGACLLMKRDFIENLSFRSNVEEESVQKIYPQLASLPNGHLQLFDEAFFAYREDADLAWRAQLFGWSCLYVPSAVGYHVRKVTPERRAELPKMLNLLGVKNRFLLQLNNYGRGYGLSVFIQGYIFRNALVVAALFMKEISSLPAIPQFLKLLRRGLIRRKDIASKIKQSHEKTSRWFKSKPYSEGVNEL